MYIVLVSVFFSFFGSCLVVGVGEGECVHVKKFGRNL